MLRGIVQGYRTKLLRAPPGSLMCSAYSTVTYIGPRFNVSSERLLVNLVGQPRIRNQGGSERKNVAYIVPLPELNYVIRQFYHITINNPCFQCNRAMTNFLVSHTCGI